MLQGELLNIVVNVIFALSMTSSGIYLAIRAYKMRSIALALLSLALLSFFSTLLTNGFLPPDDYFWRALAAANYSVLIVLFTKHAFYKNKKSPFNFVFVATLSIRIVHFIEMNLLHYVSPSYVPISAARLGGYYFHLVMLTSQLVIAFGWLSVAAFKEYAAFRSEAVEPWVRNRYVIIGISHALYAAMSFAYFIIPTDGLAFGSPDALAANIVIPPLVASYGVLSFLAWTMPGWFKRLLNAGKPVAKMTESHEIFSDVSIEIKDRVIPTPELMKVIDFLGGKLATMLKKNPGAAKGLFLMAIDKELGKFGLYTISLNNLLKVTNNSLKVILKGVGIDNADAIVAELANEIVKNQSVFLMMAV
jgi:hypothetical protein